MSRAPAEETRVVLVTAPDLATARALARGLVERRLAACVNLVPGLESVYRWRGALESASEVLLVVKTAAARLAELERFLDEEHPYELPELVALAPEHVSAAYAGWLLGEVAP